MLSTWPTFFGTKYVQEAKKHDRMMSAWRSWCQHIYIITYKVILQSHDLVVCKVDQAHNTVIKLLYDMLFYLTRNELVVWNAMIQSTNLYPLPTLSYKKNTEENRVFSHSEITNFKIKHLII